MKDFNVFWQRNGAHLFKQCGIKPLYYSSDMSDFAKFPELDQSMFIHGSVGVGKTRMLCAIAKEELKKGYSVKYISSADLIFEIQETFNTNQPNPSSKYIDVDILCLDDLGAEKVSDWARSVFYRIIDNRIAEVKKTYVTSNYTLQRISKVFDDRIASRLGGMGKVIKLTGEDRRLIKC